MATIRKPSSRRSKKARVKTLRPKPEISVCAGGVVLDARGRVLVVNQNNNSWSLPKGHVDKGENKLEAARREIREESGVSELELIRPLGQYERPRIGKHGGSDRTQLKRITLFLFKTRQTALRPSDPRNPEARWVERSKVPALLTHRKDRLFFRSILGKLPKETKK